MLNRLTNWHKPHSKDTRLFEFVHRPGLFASEGWQVPAPTVLPGQHRRPHDRPLRELAPHVLSSNVVPPEEANVLAVLHGDRVQVRQDEVRHVPHLAVDRQRDDVDGRPRRRMRGRAGAGGRLEDEAAEGTGHERAATGLSERAEEARPAVARERAAAHAVVPASATAVGAFARQPTAARYSGGASLFPGPYHLRHLRDGLDGVNVLRASVGVRTDFRDVVVVVFRPSVGLPGLPLPGLDLVIIRVIDVAALDEIHFGTRTPVSGVALDLIDRRMTVSSIAICEYIRDAATRYEVQYTV